jgi:membrane-associated protease RseP (regulator of RpoE activity)
MDTGLEQAALPEAGTGTAEDLPAMRLAIALLVLALGACAESPPPLRQVTIESPEALRLSLRELPAPALEAMGLSYGLAVVKAGAFAQRAGLRVGDVVYAVNQQRIRDVDDFTRLVAAQPGSLGLLVRRGKSDFYVPIELAPGAPALPRAPARDTLLRT